jgi:hypothetical protein
VQNLKTLANQHASLRGDGQAPLILVTGGWLAATATVALAEEVVERVRGERRIIRQNALVVVTGNFLHEHHDPAPQGGIINSRERSDQP